MRAFILRSRKMPRPGIFTDSPLFTVLTTVSVSEVRRSSACFRLTPPTSATFATNCDFVISTSWGGEGRAGAIMHPCHLGWGWLVAGAVDIAGESSGAVASDLHPPKPSACGELVHEIGTGGENVRDRLERIMSAYEDMDRRFMAAGGLG